jgi:eukaryotic-like serine/threonine-protein kinase
VSESPQPGTIIAGRYRIDGEIGAGTMGVVVAAWHLELDQAVAIKFLNPAALGTGESSERFRREARAAAKIRSEHVARVFDVGTLDNGLPYMVMELLRGHNLDEELRLRRVLPVLEAADYLLEAIEALAEAHAAGVVHRDLKPGNLFVSERADRTRIVKVLDFGVSKSFGDSASALEVGLTRTGTIVGSPLYMSPEQLRSTRTVDARTDVWALGVILYQLLTGHTPYEAELLADLCAMLLRDPPTPVNTYRNDLPAGIEAVIMRCLQREPDDRYQNVSALADALLPFASITARIHAERARRVLHNVSQDVSFSSLRNSIDSAPDTAVSAAPAASTAAASSGSRNEAVPLTLTNGKTQQSPGVEPRSRRRGTAIWVALGLGALLLVGAKAMGFLRLPARVEPTSIEAAQTPAAAALAVPVVEPIAPAPVALPAAKAEAPQPATSAEARVPPPQGLVPPRAAGAVLRPPPAHTINWAAMPRPNATAKPAVPAASTAPSARAAGQISDFGGRK